jgi:hypothetical protein
VYREKASSIFCSVLEIFLGSYSPTLLARSSSSFLPFLPPFLAPFLLGPVLLHRVLAGLVVLVIHVVKVVVAEHRGVGRVIEVLAVGVHLHHIVEGGSALDPVLHFPQKLGLVVGDLVARHPLGRVALLGQVVQVGELLHDEVVGLGRELHGLGVVRSGLRVGAHGLAVPVDGLVENHARRLPQALVLQVLRMLRLLVKLVHGRQPLELLELVVLFLL